MPTKPFIVLTLLCVSLISASAIKLSGKVITVNGNEPIDLATVFISGSSYGTLSNAEGKFELDVPLKGSYTLVVSHVSYQTATNQLQVDSDVLGLVVRLSPKDVELSDVTVTCNNHREANLDLFKKALLGTSPNAAHCDIMVPESIHFARTVQSHKAPFTATCSGQAPENTASPDSTNNAAAHTYASLKATCSDFILIKNNKLGYLIRYKLMHFELTPNRLQFFGHPYFEDIIDRYDDKKRVQRNRLDAYYGSAQHFFKSLFNHTCAGEGFTVYKVENSQEKHPTRNEGFYCPNPITRMASWLYPVQESFDLDAYIVPDTVAYRKSLTYDSCFETVYRRKIHPEYKKYAFENDTHLWGRHKQSTLFLKSISGQPLLFFENGNYDIISGNVQLLGYMSWKRLADMLPMEFDPKKAEQPQKGRNATAR